MARSVQVDNYTNGFIRIRGAQRDVPPGIFGCIIPLAGTQVAEAAFIPTIPASAAIPNVPSGVATLTFSETAHVPDSGHMLPTVNSRTQIYPDGTTAGLPGSPSYTIPANSTGTTTTFTVPPNCTNIRIMGNQHGTPSSGFPRMQLGLFEHNTTAILQPKNLIGNTDIGGVNTGARPLDFRVEPSTDLQVDIVTVIDGTQPAIDVWVSALFGAETTVVFPSINPVPTIVFPITQVPEVQRFPIAAVSVGSAGTLIIVPIANVGIKTLYLKKFSLFQDGANAAGRWLLQDTNGSSIHDMFCTNVRGLLDRGDFEGISVPGGPGVGLQIVNSGGVASFLGGYVDVVIT